jgi:hypothetical protein
MMRRMPSNGRLEGARGARQPLAQRRLLSQPLPHRHQVHVHGRQAAAHLVVQRASYARLFLLTHGHEMARQVSATPGSAA